MNRREFLKRGLEGIVVGSVPLISNCNINPFRSEKIIGVNFHFLKEKNLTYLDVKDEPLSDLRLQGEPWICSDDILRYDWSSHVVYLKKNIYLYEEDISLFGKPFVVTANEEKCYLGVLHSYSGVASSEHPSIGIIGYYDKKFILISNTSPPPGWIGNISWRDVRNDIRIKEALLANGQYHAGLYCTLVYVEVINENDASSVRYTYTLYNIDEDNLYVPDSDKMGSSIFHYFTHGVYLLGPNYKYYWSQNKVTTPLDPESDWLSLHTRIESGGYRVRTILLEGYPRIDSGHYYCKFKFPSLFILRQDEYRLSDGRTWIGEIDSTPFSLWVFDN